MLPSWEIFDTKTHFLVLLDFWDCRVRPFKANSWEGWCKRATEHISMLICVVSTIMMIRKRNLLEGAPCPFYPRSQHSSTPVTSHHHLPIFCSFHPLSSWKNLCVITIPSFHLHPHTKLFSGWCLLWVSQSTCIACDPPAVGWCGGCCGVKSGQLIFLKMSWSRFFARSVSGDHHRWVTHHPCASRML